MARRPAPTPKWNEAKACWQVRVTLPGGNGEQRRNILLRGVARTDFERAQRLAKVASDRVRAGELVPVESGENVIEWIVRWFAFREDRGLVTVDDDRSRFENHIRPKLGALPIGAVRRDDIEALVEELDGKVQAGKLSWKTAAHVWGLVTRMFADASGAKRRDLRVRADNPALGVHGPDRGASKAKQYLYPSELLQLVSCEDVPVRWRVMFAITTYLYARAGEVNALTWDDVDLERGVVHIHASMNRRTGKVSTTKTEITRRVPIEPALRPVLEALHRESGGRGRVSPVQGTDRKLSRQLQRCLRLAGVTRAELFADDASRKPITFHDLRATGITWAAFRGDDPLRIKQRAGHRTFSTTEGYIREAENLRETNFGEPFPPLPEFRIECGSSGSKWGKNPEKLVEAPGIECKPETSSDVAGSMQNADDSTSHPSPAHTVEQRNDPDAALWVAVETATAARDLVRAAELMAILQRRPTPVLTLATRRRGAR